MGKIYSILLVFFAGLWPWLLLSLLLFGYSLSLGVLLFNFLLILFCLFKPEQFLLPLLKARSWDHGRKNNYLSLIKNFKFDFKLSEFNLFTTHVGEPNIYLFWSGKNKVILVAHEEVFDLLKPSEFQSVVTSMLAPSRQKNLRILTYLNAYLSMQLGFWILLKRAFWHSSSLSSLMSFFVKIIDLVLLYIFEYTQAEFLDQNREENADMWTLNHLSTSHDWVAALDKLQSSKNKFRFWSRCLNTNAFYHPHYLENLNLWLNFKPTEKRINSRSSHEKLV